MNASILLAASMAILFVAYHTWGNFVARRLKIDPSNLVPAHTQRDGIDFEPSPRSMVLGHHFASIAGAGPIVGPIVAVAFGWVPALIWILVGSIFLGAVHDFTSLVASLRHQGRSVGDLIEDYVGRRAKRLFMMFALATLILIIAVFTDVVVQTFVKTPSVATSNALFIVAAVSMGLMTHRFNVSHILATILGIISIGFVIAGGYFFPIEFDSFSLGSIGITPRLLWVIIIMAYIGVAAVSPVWLLMQPRDYLNSFLLYAMIIAAMFGIFASGPEIKADAFTGFNVEGVGRIFPLLFVTVACGAISGFHSLVASGTTSKQLDSEKDAQFIGYGSMVIEAVLAVIALIAAASMATSDYMALRHDPIGVFSQSIANFLSVFNIPTDIAVVCIALTISAFALTTLDTCARLARFMLQEFFDSHDIPVEKKSPLATNRYLATGIIVLLGGAYCFSGQSTQVWPVFGAANQLLAAVALLSVATWMAKKGIENRFVVVPMFFMYAVTVVALGELIVTNTFGKLNLPLASVSIALLLLSLELLRQAISVLRPQKVEA